MKTVFEIALLLSITLILGCSSAKNPTLPANNPVPVSNEGVNVAVGSTGDSGTAPFGVYEGFIDPKTLTAELKPSRNAAKIGDIFDADITQFLMFQPCWNCVRIEHLSAGTIGITLGLSIKHPVPNINARPDLHVFDVRGIMILPSDTSFDLQYPLPNGAGMGDISGNARLVVNADGYTTHFDEIPADTHYFDPPIDIPGTLNPYKRFFTDTSTPAFDPHNPAGYNVFPAGSDWETQDYYLNTSQHSGILEFVFVLDASYGQSAVLKNRQSPQYYLPAFNRKEPWRVDVVITQNTLAAGDTASTAAIRAEVYDWQAGRTSDPNYPDPTHLGGIPYTSDVTGMYVSVPGLFDGVKSSATPTSGNGVWGDPYKYDIQFTNEKGALVGDYVGLVSVRDELWDAQGPIGIPQSPAGFPFEGSDIRDYAAYQAFTISINDPWVLLPDPFPGDSNTHYGFSIASGNFDNDLYTDIAVTADGADPRGTIFVYFGNGIDFDIPPIALSSDASGYDSLGYSIAVGKMNDDMFDDVVTVSQNGGIAVFLSDGAGGFNAPILRKDTLEFNSQFGDQVEIGRMNNDNFMDIVVADAGATVTAVIRAGKIFVHTFDGSSIAAPIEITQVVPGSSNTFGHYINLARFNSDDYDDILATYDDEIFPGEHYDVEIIKNNGSGGVYDRTSIRQIFPNLNTYSIGQSISTIDLNTDGIKEWIISASFNDIQSADSAGEFFIFYPDENNGFNGFRRYPNPEPVAYDRLGEYTKCTAGDINGDGTLDLIVPSPLANSWDGMVQIFLAVPGGYQYYRKLTEPPGLPHYQFYGKSAVSFDYNGDNKDEVFIGSNSNIWQGLLYVYSNL